MHEKRIFRSGWKLCEPLVCAGLKAVLQIPEGAVDAAVKWVKERFTDHSLVLTKAVSTAHDRAWQAVALALAPDTLFSHVANLFRDGDLKAVQKQIREFVATADTGIDGAADGLRTKSCNELLQLKKGGRFALEGVELTSLDLTRHASSAKVADDAHRAVHLIAADLEADAPHLAQVLTLAPPGGGTPLLAAAFAYFLRRQIATNEELARDLTFDQLRLLTLKQQAGFGNLERVFEGKWEALTELLADAFATLNAKVDSSNAKLDEVLRVLHVVTEARNPLKVTVENEQQKRLVKDIIEQVRALPPELRTSDMLSRLGDILAAAGQFKEAAEEQKAAADAAKEEADRQAEAEAAYKQFKAECEISKWDAALAALTRAIALDEKRFRPVPKHYSIEAILGAGAFGVVLKCRDTTEKDDNGNHLVMAVKTFRETDLDHPVDEVFAEASVLKNLTHENIVRIHERGFADTVAQQRPFLAMEFVPGVTLEQYLAKWGRLEVDEFLAIFRQIATGLHAAHSARRAVIHRDVKPANVLITGIGAVSPPAIDHPPRSVIETAKMIHQLRAEVGDGAPTADHLRRLAALLARHTVDELGEMKNHLGLQVTSEPAKGSAVDQLFIRAEARWAERLKKVRVKLIDFGLAVHTSARSASLRLPPPKRTQHDRCIAGTMKYAPPEQCSERTYPIGPHSDVYAFGKTALEALLGTTQPTHKHWLKLPDWLADMLARCVDEDYFADNPDEGRFHGFVPILEALTAATPPTPAPPQPPPTSAPTKHRYNCPTCLFQWDDTVPRGYRPELVVCPSCDADVILDTQDRGSVTPEPVQNSKSAGITKLRTTCPLCRAKFRFPLKRGGDRAKCPQCGMWLLLPTEDGGIAIVSPYPAPGSTEPTRRAGDKFHLHLPGGLWMPFAWCPPGTFLMGSPEWEEGRNDDEQQHEVRLTKGFFCGVHPVTQAEWKAVMGTEPSHFKRVNLPVERVSWEDAQAFCRKVRVLGEKPIRLPTEAEWEYACRGGTTTPFYWGGELNGTQANHDGNRPYGTTSKGQSMEKTTPVGSYVGKVTPHPWGLTDVHGNVWEWCADWFDEEFYAHSPKDDPECRSGKTNHRIVRGGSWCNDAQDCRAALRNAAGPALHDCYFGFRVVFCLD